MIATEWLDLAVILLGLIFGSFTNVLIHRLPRQKSVVFPSSACTSCKKKLSWFENIPVLSFLFLRGRCRSCGKKISLRYPLVEILVASAFYITYTKFGLSLELVCRDWPFLLILIAAAFIDWEHRIIPDVLSIGGTALGLVTSFVDQDHPPQFFLWGAVVGFVAFYGLAYFYFKLSGQSGLGGGDIKFLAMVGAFLGVKGVFVTILISSVVGSVVGIAWALSLQSRSKKKKNKRLMQFAIPYGPFLVLGALVYYGFEDSRWLQYILPI